MKGRYDNKKSEAVRLADASLQEAHRAMVGRPPEHWLEGIAKVHAAVDSTDDDVLDGALRAAYAELMWAKKDRCPPSFWKDALAAVEAVWVP
jgi:hypothetical protein